MGMQGLWDLYIGGCQNYGPLSGTLNTRGRIVLRTPKGTIILTTTHVFCLKGVEKLLHSGLGWDQGWRRGGIATYIVNRALQKLVILHIRIIEGW